MRCGSRHTAGGESEDRKIGRKPEGGDAPRTPLNVRRGENSPVGKGTGGAFFHGAVRGRWGRRICGTPENTGWPRWLFGVRCAPMRTSWIGKSVVALSLVAACAVPAC